MVRRKGLQQASPMSMPSSVLGSCVYIALKRPEIFEKVRIVNDPSLKPSITLCSWVDSKLTSTVKEVGGCRSLNDIAPCSCLPLRELHALNPVNPSAV